MGTRPDIGPFLRSATSFWGNGRKRNILAVVCLVLLCFVLYGNTLGNGFVLDDLIVVDNNPFISSWANLKHFFDPGKYFVASGERTYRPVTTLSYFLDYSIWRYNPAGYHLTNMLIHAANGVLIYFILFQLIMRSKRTGLAPAGDGWTAGMAPLIAAFIFIAHPAQTEGVDFVGGRHDLVMAFFYLGAVLSYLKASSGPSGTNLKYYLLSLVLFAFSCFAKESGITLPAVLVLADVFTYSGERWSGFWKKRAAMYAGFGVVALVYIYVRSVHMVFGGEFLETSAKRFPALAWMFMNYLRILFFPVRLSTEYGAGPGYPTKIPDSFSQPEFYVPTAVVFLLAAAVILLRRKAPMVFFGAAWFFITFLPASNIIVHIISFPVREKYIYLPAAGFYIALTFVMCQAAETFMKKGYSPQKVKRVLGAVVAVLVVACSARTVARNADWKDGVSLWSATIASSQGSYRAYYNLGMSYEYERGDTEKAVQAFRESLKNYDLPATHDALGLVYLRNGRYEESLAELTLANKGNPQLGSVYYHLGQLYLETGKPDKAIEVVEKGLTDARTTFPYYDPVPLADLRAVLGKAWFYKKDYEKTVAELRTSLGIRPGDPETCYYLGRAYVMKGMFQDAERAFSEALRVDPRNVATRYALANVYLKSKQLDKAEKEYLLILKVDPAHSDSRNNLANIYYSRGMVGRAVEEYNKILETNPSHFRARNNLANIYLMNRQYDKAIAGYRKVLENESSSAVVHYNLGLAYEGKGMLAEAEEEWRAALTIDPGFGQAAEAIRQSEARRNGGKQF